MLRSLLSLRIKEVDLKKDTEDTAPKKKFMKYKEKQKHLSRMQRKVCVYLCLCLSVCVCFRCCPLCV